MQDDFGGGGCCGGCDDDDDDGDANLAPWLMREPRSGGSDADPLDGTRTNASAGCPCNWLGTSRIRSTRWSLGDSPSLLLCFPPMHEKTAV